MDTPYTVVVTPGSWITGYLCEVCDDEIQAGHFARVLDIDHSDRLGRAVAKVAHEDCVQSQSTMVVVDQERT